MNNLRGILLMIVAMAGFTLEDAFVKMAAATLPVGQILLIIGVGGTAIFAALARAGGARLITPVLLTRPVMIRNLAEMLGTMAFISAIAVTPLSTVSAIIQATPLAVTLGAALFLGATVGWRRWTAILVGFAGVLLIVRPGGAAFDLGALLAVFAVFMLAARDLATRVVPGRISSMVLATYGFATVIPAGAILLVFSGGAVMPDRGAWLALLGALAVGPVAYYAIIASVRVGDIVVVTPFRYTRLLFALVVGGLVFDERPDALMLTGAAIIIVSGLYTFVREARLARGPRPLPPEAPGG
ncbi:DMT family transporter [Palleronia sp. KMU-117]|uniref:DMT family transporter n=1 Tax=Palleronia sp. KMU-117 TaxID=3434108 RepID=UPI003D7394D8